MAILVAANSIKETTPVGEENNVTLSNSIKGENVMQCASLSCYLAVRLSKCEKLGWEEVWDGRRDYSSCHSSLSPSSLALPGQHDSSQSQQSKYIMITNSPDRHSLQTAPLLLVSQLNYVVVCFCFLVKCTRGWYDQTFVWVGMWRIKRDIL